MNELHLTDIMNILPHRYPFLLIDKVLSWTPYTQIHAIKNVTCNESFFQGHFPSDPIMPGVMILESMAQSAGVLAYLSERTTAKDAIYYLASVENAKFKKTVRPGDVMNIFVNFRYHRGRFVKVESEVFVNHQMVCSATMTSAQKS